ncbi:MAG: thioesterase family protein [bacterium]|nr:thioesterase [Gammaproteobacteria bacterium]HIL95329.1 thioesterase [Pseudomonadales bacterium]
MSESFVGLSATINQTVTDSMLANSVGSGSVSVFATPELILLLEKTAVAALDGKLDSGQTTVGSALDVTHLAATPAGMNVSGFARVTEVDGRKLTFEVSAKDDSDEIAEGTHTRFIVEAEKFQKRANSKLNNS